MHLTGLHLIGMRLTGVHLIGVHLTGVHLTGVPLTGVSFTGVLYRRASYRRGSYRLVTGVHRTGVHFSQARTSHITRRAPLWLSHCSEKGCCTKWVFENGGPESVPPGNGSSSVEQLYRPSAGASQASAGQPK